MLVTFLVGNGFDISCGLKTSYKDFYEWYLNQPSSSSSIIKMKKSISIDYENWADFEMGLSEYTTNFKASVINDFYECYDDAQINMIKYLQFQDNSVNLDLLTEEQILDFRNSIFNFYDELPSKGKSEIGVLLEEEQIIDYSFISYNYTSVLNKILLKINQIENKYERAQPFLMKKCRIKPNVINIHGSLENHPILGVSEEAFIVNKEIIDTPYFKQTMVKADAVKAIDEAWYDSANSLINKSNVVCIFGMSLGDSDSLWWKNIINHLETQSLSHLIIYWYTKNPPDNISARSVAINKDKVKEILYKSTGLSKDRITKIEERIHIIFNTKQVLQISVPKAVTLPVNKDVMKTSISEVKKLIREKS